MLNGGNVSLVGGKVPLDDAFFNVFLGRDDGVRSRLSDIARGRRRSRSRGAEGVFR
jgi:hypothetical protein